MIPAVNVPLLDEPWVYTQVSLLRDRLADPKFGTLAPEGRDGGADWHLAVPDLMDDQRQEND